MDLQLIARYYELAVEEKEQYRSIFNEILSYCHPSYQINDESPQKVSFNDVDPFITTEIDTALNFAANAILTRGNKFGRVRVNETLYKTVNKEQRISSKDISDLNKKYEELTDLGYSYLSSSNGYREVIKALWEAIVLGTGAVTIVDTGSLLRPFTFRYLPLNNLFYYEDAFGNPNHTFKKHYNMTPARLKEMFGMYDSFNISQLEFKDELSTIDVIESCIPLMDDKGNITYTTTITDESFQITIGIKESDYNPIIIFRFDNSSEQILGHGLGLKALKSFKDLKKAKERRDKQAELIINPPLKTVGDKNLISQISFKPGAVNNGGSGAADALTGLRNTFEIAPIVSNPTLVPLERDIEIAKAEIREIFMSNPLGNIEEFKSRSASESNARMELFRTRWAGAFQNLQEELLEPLLVNISKILIANNIVEFEDVRFDLAQFDYINKLTHSADIEDVKELLQAVQYTAQLSQVSIQAGLEPTRASNMILDKFGVPEDVRLTKEEKAKLAQQQAQAAQQAQMANNNAQAAKRNAESAKMYNDMGY